MKPRKIFSTFAISLILYVATSGLATARDTDIYFVNASTSGSAIRPNILLVLDTSGSMNEQVSGTTKMRIDVMRTALLTLLDEMDNVNVGITRYSLNSGGPIVYPTQYIDQSLTDSGNFQVVVQDSPDDAQQLTSGGSSGTVTINGTELDLGVTSGGTSTAVGLRFRNAYIPKGATITSAKIVMKASEDLTGTVNLKITGDYSEDSPIYTTATSNVTGRTQTDDVTSPVSVAWSITSNWEDGEWYETPDIKTVVQKIIDGQSDWCGGNALSFTFERTDSSTNRRQIYAYDVYHNAPIPSVQSSYGAPVASLVVTYTPPTSGSYCYQTTARVSSGTDDAEEDNQGDMDLTGSLSNNEISLGGQKYVGVRFSTVDVPKDATIKSAVLEFEIGSTISGSTSLDLNVRGHLTPSSATFTSTDDNISSRITGTGSSPTTSTVAWGSVANSAVNQRIQSPDISAIVQELVNQTTWASGNPVTLVVTRSSGSSSRKVESYDSEPAAGALLRIRYHSTSTTVPKYTVRDKLKALAVGWRAQGDTPTVDSLYEGALYYRGEDVDYGKTRGGQLSDFARFTRLSDPTSYTGGTLSQPTGCTNADPDAATCVTESITGTPTYTSPIAYSCQTNHMVLLTDGLATYNSSSSKILTMTGASACSSSGSDACGSTLTGFLYDDDQSGVSDKQVVRTHTIGLNISGSFLEDLATNGGGVYKTATNAEDLLVAFQSILNEVKTDPTSFVSPSLSVNAFNRLYNRDEVYFTLFSPQLSVRWPGNLKKYKLSDGTECTTCDFGDVVDANDNEAIDSVTSKIVSSAKSFWSGSADGPEVQTGGAGEEVASYSTRRVYTYTGTASTSDDDDFPGSLEDLTQSRHQVVTTNTVIIDAMLGAADSTERSNIINWMRGQDIEDEDNDGSTSDQRWKFSDALHSRPATVTYGCDSATICGITSDPVTKLIVGTNDGGVRMIDGATGEEDWIVYIPEFLTTQKTLKANGNDTHIDGVDGVPTVRVIDNDNDGIIEPADSDKVQLFIGMRRGGSYIYAFDITPTSVLTTASAVGSIKPKFMWRIKNSMADFSKLGQTWSRPLLTNVWTICTETTSGVGCNDGQGGTKDSELRAVLMFAGGYDTNFDTTIPTGTDTVGNAIYMVDPDDGSRLWWASGSSSGADLELANMKYSIPSDLTLIDSNLDGATDRIYVGDTRGQLWRIDLDNQINPDGASTSARNGSTAGYVFADIGCTSGARTNDCSATANQNKRAFFYPPDVAQVRDADFSSAVTYDYVTIATGDREDPLDKKTSTISETAIYNRIYAFRDINIALGAPASTPTALTESNLYNATSNTLGNTSNSGYATALASLKSSSGWYIDLIDASTSSWLGEKSLARTTIFSGVLYVTTYLPPQTTVSSPTTCPTAAEGTAYVYALNLWNAAAANNNTSRSETLGGGIPSELVVIIREGGASGLAGTSGGGKNVNVGDPSLQKRTYWYQD